MAAVVKRVPVGTTVLVRDLFHALRRGQGLPRIQLYNTVGAVIIQSNEQDKNADVFNGVKMQREFRFVQRPCRSRVAFRGTACLSLLAF